eukprot:gnl/TRDRNA2_/TRDRNA2_192220_c0_seq1.p1 gnl/TRDRNA2_/TRDRNA2_192220_c0~~gnl/TRDRNA2_/TRDRNA2_192220_c0_seq1.p1  ORF type:complete len:223 (+),score=24.04 gnl/TRDRNA2_/TRDRNA2_192220_c0_seq1:80-748(+)
MVIPLGSPGSQVSIESLPDEAKSLLVGVKWCVIGLWVFGLVLFFVYDSFDALSALCLAIFGTFLLSEDPHLATCYNSLRQSVIGQCCGNPGTPMLAPFLVFSFVNSVVDGLEITQAFTHYGKQTMTHPLVWLKIGISVCEVASTALSYRVLKIVAPTLAEAEDYRDYQRLPEGPSGMTGLGPGRGLGGLVAPRQQRVPGAGPVGAGGQSFVPFSGQGHKLTT